MTGFSSSFLLDEEHTLVSYNVYIWEDAASIFREVKARGAGGMPPGGKICMIEPSRHSKWRRWCACEYIGMKM